MALKKDIFYSNDLFKTFFKNHFDIAIRLVGVLCELADLPENNGAKDDYKRSNVKSKKLFK